MDDHDHERCTPEAARERAAWTRDIAKMLRGQTGAPPEMRPGILYAADFLDPPAGGMHVGAYLAADPVDAARLAELIASRREDPARVPAVVEVEEDDDEGDDVPHDSPEAGRSSGRWQPLGEPGGMAHLDFAEDAARRAREADDEGREG